MLDAASKNFFLPDTFTFTTLINERPISRPNTWAGIIITVLTWYFPVFETGLLLQKALRAKVMETGVPSAVSYQPPTLLIFGQLSCFRKVNLSLLVNFL